MLVTCRGVAYFSLIASSIQLRTLTNVQPHVLALVQFICRQSACNSLNVPKSLSSSLPLGLPERPAMAQREGLCEHRAVKTMMRTSPSQHTDTPLSIAHGRFADGLTESSLLVHFSIIQYSDLGHRWCHAEFSRDRLAYFESGKFNIFHGVSLQRNVSCAETRVRAEGNSLLSFLLWARFPFAGDEWMNGWGTLSCSKAGKAWVAAEAKRQTTVRLTGCSHFIIAIHSEGNSASQDRTFVGLGETHFACGVFSDHNAVIYSLEEASNFTLPLCHSERV